MKLWLPFSRTAQLRLLAVGFGLVLALALSGVAELVVRFAKLAPALHRIRPDMPEAAYRASANPRLGYEFKSNYRNSKPDLQESFPFTNAHGQRDVERTLEKPAGWTRIIMLGDSVVAGHGILDVRDTIPLQLERRLAGRNVEVLNFGVGGYCTGGEVELLKVKGLAFHPDVVVLVFVSNDYSDLNTQAHRYRRHRPQWAEALFVHSHLFRLIALRLNWYQFRTESDPVLMAQQLLRQNNAALGPNNVEEGFALLSRLALDRGFETFCVLWPGFLDDRIIDDDLRGEVTNRPVAVEEIAVRYQVPTYRLSDYFRRDLARLTTPGAPRISPRKLYTIGDGMHPSIKGAAVAADAILDILLHRQGKGLDDQFGPSGEPATTNSSPR